MEKEYLSFVKESGQDGFEFVDGTHAHLIVGQISKINILVGANNSRKSRFMRLVVKKEVLPTVSEELTLVLRKGIAAFNNIIANIKSEELFNVEQYESTRLNKPSWMPALKNFPAHFKEVDDKLDLFNKTIIKRDKHWILDREQISNLKQRLISLFEETVEKGSNAIADYRHYSDFFELLYQNCYNRQRFESAGLIAFDRIAIYEQDWLNIHRAFEDILDYGTIDEHPSKIFIPALRGSTPLHSSITGKDLLAPGTYEYSTSCLYFPDLKADRLYQISAGDRLHHTILHDRNSTFEKREQFQRFQSFVGNSFFGGKRVEIVAHPNTKAQTVRIYIEGEKERELKDLGDGIQHLLILLYPIFMADKNTWIFIDEPELSLHPGFQNLFLDTLLNNPDLKAKNLRYFMTTHSNHFLSHALRSPDEVSVFSFSQYNKDQSIIRCVHGGDTTVLDQLGVENASVYMANCSIWVEGVSDRRYLQAFLKAYCGQTDEDGKALFPEFKEGLDYTFFEYAGTNLTHYLFDPDEDDPNLIDSFKNANRIFLLADQDAGKDDKHDKLHALKSDNFEYHTTGAREVENILPPFVYQDFIASYPSQKNLTFSATLQDYSDESMGKFLREHIGASSLKYGETTLTTKYKNDLSELVQYKSCTWAQLSESKDIVRITKAVYDFIQRHNTSRN